MIFGVNNFKSFLGARGSGQQEHFRTPFYAILGVTSLLWAGCNSESGSLHDSTASNVIGTYSLATVDGKKVPCTISHQGSSIQIASGSFQIRPDGGCNSRIQFVSPSGKPAEKEVAANWTQDGKSLNFQWKGAGKTIGAIEGDTFTMKNEGMVFAYQRQTSATNR